MMMYRYAIGNAERGGGIEPKYGWLDALAEQTHQPYFPNNTGGGPTIRVNEVFVF
jgi:hypothetical protein